MPVGACRRLRGAERLRRERPGPVPCSERTPTRAPTAARSTRSAGSPAMRRRRPSAHGPCVRVHALTRSSEYTRARRRADRDGLLVSRVRRVVSCLEGSWSVGDDGGHHEGGGESSDAGQSGQLDVADASEPGDVGSDDAQEVIGFAGESLRLNDRGDVGGGGFQRGDGVAGRCLEPRVSSTMLAPTSATTTRSLSTTPVSTAYRSGSPSSTPHDTPLPVPTHDRSRTPDAAVVDRAQRRLGRSSAASATTGPVTPPTARPRPCRGPARPRPVHGARAAPPAARGPRSRRGGRRCRRARRAGRARRRRGAGTP